jgi:hypothetical protein
VLSPYNNTLLAYEKVPACWLVWAARDVLDATIPSWCANVPSYILSTTDRGNDLALDDDVSLYEEGLYTLVLDEFGFSTIDATLRFLIQQSNYTNGRLDPITFATIPTVVRHPKTRNISGRAVVVKVTETAAAMEPLRHRMNRLAWQGWAPLCSSSWSSWADWQWNKSVPSFNTVGSIAILPRWLRHENTKAVRTKMMVDRCIAIMSTTMMPATRREKSSWYRNGPPIISKRMPTLPSFRRCCNTVSLEMLQHRQPVPGGRSTTDDWYNAVQIQ